MSIKFTLVLACLFITSCHTSWAIIDNNNKSVRLGEVIFKAPVNWVIYNDHNNRYAGGSSVRLPDGDIQRVMISKNGFRLDIIDIMRLNTHYAFPTIKQSVDDQVLPFELAELFIAEQKMLTGINIFTITRSEPTKIAGHDGFLVQFHFRNSSGLYIEQMTYGFVKKGYFYVFSFRAPSLHFFDANIRDFVQMLESITLDS